MSRFKILINLMMLSNIIAFVLLISCNNTNSSSLEITLIEKETYKIKLNDSLVCNKEALTGFYKLAQYNDSIFLYYFDWINSKMIFYHLQSGALIKSLSLSKLSHLNLDKKIDLLWFQKNTIALFSDRDQMIVLVNLQGDIIKSFSSKDGDSTFPPYMAVSFGDRGMLFDKQNNQLIIQIAYIDVVLSRKEHFENYFSRPMFQRIELTNPDNYIKYVHAPPNYAKGNYYGNFNIFKCLGGNNCIVYSFAANDDIYIYENNDTNGISKFAGSNLHPIFKPYDISELQNFAYLRKYSICQPYYQKIVYNEFSHLYFRVFKPFINYLNEDDEILRNYEIPWSMIVLDDNFKLIGEIKMDPAKYSSKTIFPVNKGVIISNTRYQNERSEYLSFSLLSVE